jgi:hypothetical protein
LSQFFSVGLCSLLLHCNFGIQTWH